jgi:organic hydroperoxide reductase OsmC/OhrA
MSEHGVSVRWERAGGDFTYETYTRDHVWRFAGGVVVPASGAPEFRGNPERVDPEAAFVAALSSCHMLTFLAIAARKRLVVDAYEDQAVGWLEKNEAGKLAMTRVVLRPRVVFAGGAPPPETVSDLHERAHRECFIANSVLARVEVEAR